MKAMTDINNNFNVKGKKNNLSPVSDADREIPTFGSTYNAGTSFPALSIDPRVGSSLSASETDGRFYLSHGICLFCFVLCVVFVFPFGV